MVPGFNHNVKYKGQVFHVQTEDSGVECPHVITHLFLGGNIVQTSKTSYDDLLNTPDLVDKVKQLMQNQHKKMLRSLVSGAFDERIAERSAGASMLNGPAPLNVERGQGRSSSMMSIMEGTGSGDDSPQKTAAAAPPAVAGPAAPELAEAQPVTAPSEPAPQKSRTKFSSATAFLAELDEGTQTGPTAATEEEAVPRAENKPQMPVMPPPSTVPPLSALGPIHRAPTTATSGMAAAAANLAAMQSRSITSEHIPITARNIKIVRPSRTHTEEPSIFDLPPATNYEDVFKPQQPEAAQPAVETMLDGDSLNNVYQSNPEAIDNIFGSESDSSLDDVLLGYLLSVEQN